LPEYANGDEVLTAAVLRANGLGGKHGVLIVEGPEDAGFFAPWCAKSPGQLLVARKRLALAAHGKMGAEERTKIAVVVDCDGSAGQYAGMASNLIVTTHNDLEADLMFVDGLHAAVIQLLAGGVAAERLEPIRAEIVRRATAVATSIEALRHGASNAGIPLRGDLRKLKVARIREERAEAVDRDAALSELLRLHAASHGRTISDEEMERIKRSSDGRFVELGAVNGKVLLASASAVLQQDFSVAPVRLAGFGETVRASVGADPSRREQLGVVQRLRRWEVEHNIQLLAG
jgi:hypothetical protein